MQVTLQIPRRIWQRTSAYVLQDNIERHAFIYCGRSGNFMDIRLHGVDLRLPLDTDYENASAIDIVLKREYVIQCLEKARHSEQSIIDVHSHPFEKEAHFSNVDYKYGSKAADWITRKISEGTFPYILWGMVVVGRQSAEGLVWNHELRKFQEFYEIDIEGVRETREPEREVTKKPWQRLLNPKAYFGHKREQTYKKSTNVLVSMGRIPLDRMSVHFDPESVGLFALPVVKEYTDRALGQSCGIPVVLVERTAAKRFHPLVFVDSEIHFNNRRLGCGVGFHAGCECEFPVVAASVRNKFVIIDLREHLSGREVQANAIMNATKQYFDKIAGGTGAFECLM